MDEKTKKELEKLIKEDLKIRFKKKSNKKSNLSPEEKKRRLLEIIENQRFISSLNNGKESPSNVSDFKTRDFHGKIGLFE